MSDPTNAGPRARGRGSWVSEPPDTPPTDRGYQITTPPETPRQPFQAHWFTGVTHLSSEDVFSHLYDVTGATLFALPHGKNGYKSHYQTPDLPGLSVLCDPGDPDNMPPVCLVVPGDSCEALGWERLQALSSPFKPTRVDLAFDDFPFTPSEVKSLVLTGSVRTRAQRHTLKAHEDYKDTTDDNLTPHDTVSLGGRGSSQFFRCYNSRGFTRGELELKGDMAVAAYELLQSPLDQAREIAISFLRRFIDFVDPDSDSNMSRRFVLPRWRRWFLAVQKAVIHLPPRPVQTLQRSWDWMERQLSPMLAVLSDVDMQRFYESIYQSKMTRLTPRHRLLLGSV